MAELSKVDDRAFDLRLYSENFPNDKCQRAFEKYNGSRVGQSAAEWNEIKRIFIEGWLACVRETPERADGIG